MIGDNDGDKAETVSKNGLHR